MENPFTNLLNKLKSVKDDDVKIVKIGDTAHDHMGFRTISSDHTKYSNEDYERLAEKWGEGWVNMPDASHYSRNNGSPST